MNRIKGLYTLWNKGLIHILTGSFLTKFIAMFGSIFIVRILTKQEYGQLSYMENLYGYIYLLAGLGVNNAIFRYVVLAKSENEQAVYYYYLRRTCFIANCFVTVTAVVFMMFYPHPSEFAVTNGLLIIFLSVLPVQTICEGNLLTFRALFDNRRYAVYSCLISAGIVIFKIAYSYIWNLKGTIFALINLYLLMAVVTSRILKKYYFPKNLFKDSIPIISAEQRNEIWKYSLQYMITNGVWAMFMLNDIYLLGKIGNNSLIVANYKVAYTIPGSISILSTAVGMYVAPYFVKNENNKIWIKRNFKKVYLANVALVLGIAVIIFCFSKFIITIIYGEQYLDTVKLMRILLLASFFNAGLRYPCANILAAMGNIKYNMLISLIGVCFQLMINLYMIPKYGETGVAVTSCFVYFIMAISLLVIFVRKYYGKD